MFVKNQPPRWLCILLHLLILFGTVTHSQLLLPNVDSFQPSAFNSSVESHARAVSRLFPRQVPTGDPSVPGPEGAHYLRAVSKGCGHLAMLAKDDVDQSPFTTRAALSDNGWTYQPNQAYFVSQFTVFNSLGLATDAPNNLQYRWLQDQAGATTQVWGDSPAGSVYGATGASYENTMNPVGGMLMCNNNYGPRSMIVNEHMPGPKPPLSQLSDVMWLQWMEAIAVRGDNSLVSNVKYIYRHLVTDWTSRVVLGEINTLQGQDLEYWPGKTYSMTAEDDQEREIAAAILGTPNGNAVAFFLAQHRTDLGKKTISKVTLWGLGDPDYHLLFYIEDA